MGEYDLTLLYLYLGEEKNTLSCHLEILSFRYCCVGKITIAILRFLGIRSRFVNVSSVSSYCFIFFHLFRLFIFSKLSALLSA